MVEGAQGAKVFVIDVYFTQSTHDMFVNKRIGKRWLGHQSRRGRCMATSLAAEYMRPNKVGGYLKSVSRRWLVKVGSTSLLLLGIRPHVKSSITMKVKKKNAFAPLAVL